MTVPFRSLDLEYPPDVKEILDNSDRQDVRILGAFLEDLMEELTSSLDYLDKSSRDPSRLSTDGTALTTQLETIEKKITTVKSELLDSLLTTGVRLLGPVTNEFYSTDGLTGPFHRSVTGVAGAANGYLRLSGTGSASPCYAYMGSSRGQFLPKDGDWTVIAEVTECGTAWERAGIGVAPFAFTDGTDWAAVGQAACFFLNGRVYGVDGTIGFTGVLGVLPSRATPIYVRIAQTFPSDVRTLTYSYKIGTGAWTQIQQTTPGANYFAADLDVGPLAGMNANPFDIELGNIEVDYDPSNVGEVYAFIPTQGFGGYEEDHVYIKQKNGKYKDINPSDAINKDTPFLVWDRDMSVLRKWDGTDWSIVLLPTVPHAPTHEDGGSDELEVEGLAAASTTATHVFRPDASGGVEAEDLPHADTSGQTADDHHNETHTHVSHTGIGTDDHHAKSHAHDGADGSGTVAHGDTTGQTTDDHHNETHTIVSHDTDATGAELDTLTDGSDADALHEHSVENLTTSGAAKTYPVVQPDGTFVMEVSQPDYHAHAGWAQYLKWFEGAA